ncbi:MAG: DNA adenine methylase [Chloroflexi bacterium]|nr:DNA adenine methylase [Chloroflexota bacterium]
MRAQITPRPFLKWAGGKTQLIEELVRRMPLQFENYHEPFIGGGALFFKLYRENKIRRATISDLNAELIDTYIAIRDHVADVIGTLAEFPHRAEFFYRLRAQAPAELDLVHRAARMIYLNKTGYNGLYRVNRRGQFNVPFGSYKSPQYCDEVNLHAVARALQNVAIVCAPFDQIVERAAPGDWVYFDPPYAPLSATSNFTAYHATGFGFADQIKLRDVCVALDARAVRVMISNSSAESIRALYAVAPFRIEQVLANRAINSNGKGRGKLVELIITNYA